MCWMGTLYRLMMMYCAVVSAVLEGKSNCSQVHAAVWD